MCTHTVTLACLDSVKHHPGGYVPGEEIPNGKNGTKGEGIVHIAHMQHLCLCASSLYSQNWNLLTVKISIR